MGRRVTLLAVGNQVVNHLVKQSVVDFLRCLDKELADFDFEVSVFQPTEESFSDSSTRELAHLSASIRDHQPRLRQFAAEVNPVQFMEAVAKISHCQIDFGIAPTYVGFATHSMQKY